MENVFVTPNLKIFFNIGDLIRQHLKDPKSTEHQSISQNALLFFMKQGKFKQPYHELMQQALADKESKFAKFFMENIAETNTDSELSKTANQLILTSANAMAIQAISQKEQSIFLEDEPRFVGIWSPDISNDSALNANRIQKYINGDTKWFNAHEPALTTLKRAIFDDQELIEQYNLSDSKWTDLVNTVIEEFLVAISAVSPTTSGITYYVMDQPTHAAEISAEINQDSQLLHNLQHQFAKAPDEPFAQSMFTLFFINNESTQLIYQSLIEAYAKNNPDIISNAFIKIYS